MKYGRLEEKTEEISWEKKKEKKTANEIQQ